MRLLARSSLFGVLVVVLCCVFPCVSRGQTWGALYHGPWTEWYSGGSLQQVIATSDGGFLLVGTTNNRGVVIKTTSDGSPVWSRLIKGMGYQADTSLVSAVEASNGDFVVVGNVFAKHDINPAAAAAAGSWDVYAVRVSSGGSLLWEKLYYRKNAGTAAPDTQEFAQTVYKRCPSGGTNCSFIITGSLSYSQVNSTCPYNGYKASHVIVLDENGGVTNDFLMGGPSSTGDGGKQTILTEDGSYLVVTDLSYPAPLSMYTVGIQKYNSSGGLIWTRAYAEDVGPATIKMSSGAVGEASDGYVISASSYDATLSTPLGAAVFLKVDKGTGNTVQWARKHKVWSYSNSLWNSSIQVLPDSSVLSVWDDGSTTANDRLLRISGSDGGLMSATEYRGTISGFSGQTGGSVLQSIMLLMSGYNMVLGHADAAGLFDKTCSAIPASSVLADTTTKAVSSIVVVSGYGPHSCNTTVERVQSLNVQLTEGGTISQVKRCEPFPEISADAQGDFGQLSPSGSKVLRVYLSNYNGLTPMLVTGVKITDTGNFRVDSSTCEGVTLYPVNHPSAPNGYKTGCEVAVSFVPKTGGDFSTAISFGSDAGVTPTMVLKGSAFVISATTPTPAPTLSPTATPTPTATPDQCFSLRVTLRQKSQGQVVVSPKPNCGASRYRKGTKVQLKALPKKGYRFLRWSGAVQTTKPVARLVINRNLACIGTFKRR